MASQFCVRVGNNIRRIFRVSNKGRKKQKLYNNE